METEVDAWLKELLMSPDGFRLTERFKEDKEAFRAFEKELFRSKEAAVQRQKEELLIFLNRMTDFIKEAFGEDVELTDWLHGIKSHGDYGLTGFSRPEMDKHDGPAFEPEGAGRATANAYQRDGGNV